MSAFVVRETTHHGSYRNVRIVEMVDGLTRENVAHMLSSCPYPYVVTAPGKADPDLVASHNAHAVNVVLSGLTLDGRADHGWTTWEVVP